MNDITPNSGRHVPIEATTRRKFKLGRVLAGTAAGAAMVAIANHLAARNAERRHLPLEKFIVVDGVRLRYRESGEGRAIVLLHGNGAMAEDFEISGIEGLLVQNHRVVAFDRPGFGFSSRPRTRIWTAQAQAALLDKALLRLGIERAVIVGHSWGTLVAIALALHNPQRVAGLVLIAGYYFPSIRTDVALTSWPAMPVFGDVLRYTISPILARIAAPSVKRKLFAPAKVPLRFERDFSVELAVRPSQIRASAVETALMIPTTANLSARYAELRMPVTLIAAKGDQIVNFDRQTLRLSRNIEGSTLHLIPEAGHMVHHTAPQEVAALIKDAAKVSVGSSDPAHFH